MPTKTLKLFSTVHLEKKNNAKAQILCLEKKEANDGAVFFTGCHGFKYHLLQRDDHGH